MTTDEPGPGSQLAEVLVVTPVHVWEINRYMHSPDHWPDNPPELTHVAVLRNVEVFDFAECEK